MSCYQIRLVVILIIAFGATVAADDWPHWRGPNRNGVLSEASQWKPRAWPASEPAWRTNVGEGSTSPLVFNNRLYTMGWQDGQDTVVCLDAATGKLIWRQSYTSPRYGRLATGDQSIYSATSSTPEFDTTTGMLYTLGVDGDLHCWDTANNGNMIWHINLYENFEVPRRPKVGRSGLRDYGYTSSPLVFRNWLVVEVGAKQGNLFGFDKRSGETVWRSESTSEAGHTGGPVPLTVEGTPCVAVHNFAGLLVARLDKGNEGKTVATYPWVTSFANNIATVAVEKNSVLLTSSYNHHKIARFDINLRGATKVWEQGEASKVCSPVIFEGNIYWAWRQLVCLDFESGKLRWKGGRFGDQGSCIATSDGRLLIWSGKGQLTLAETSRQSPDQYSELASRDVLERDDAWPHLVLSEGRLYCKDRRGELVCLPVR